MLGIDFDDFDDAHLETLLKTCTRSDVSKLEMLAAAMLHVFACQIVREISMRAKAARASKESIEA